MLSWVMRLTAPLPRGGRLAEAPLDRLRSIAGRKAALLACSLIGFTLAGWAQTPRRSPAFEPLNSEPTPDFFPETRTRPTERVPIFFPPIVPPLDWPVAHAVVAPGRLPASPDLAPYVNEFFYPSLSTRLHTSTLYDKGRIMLGQYRTRKIELQKELQAELARQRGAEPATRQQALEALARTQKSKLLQLENEAEQLRKELMNGNFGWSALREWHLGDKEKRGFSPTEIAIVMRGYAYYQNGLLPAQRQLLREIVIDLIGAVDQKAASNTPPPYLFFSPEPARVLLPEDLPAELAAKVAAYQSKKSRLKKELYDTIHAYDGTHLRIFSNPLKALADRQAPQFAEVDALAEEIRRGLAQSAVPLVTTQRSPLPAALTVRISALLRDRANAQRDATAKADAIQARTYDPTRIRIAYRFDEEGMKSVAIPIRTPRSPPGKEEEQIVTKVRADLAAVSEGYGRQIAELFNEQDAIRRDAGEFLGETKREKIDAALISAARIAALKETEDAYSDYRTAVFEPGLAVEQRRLLFDAAIERLALPLPRGEMQVTTRSANW